MSTAHLDGHAAHEHGHGDHPEFLRHHFDNPAQQESASKLGMWVFLATELLMFSGLFLAYFIIRSNYPEMVLEAHESLDKILGSINTVVLITSSLTMALAVRASQLGKRNEAQIHLLFTLIFALAFMVIKYFEYTAKFSHGTLPGFGFGEYIVDQESGTLMIQDAWYGGAQMFYGIYFTMTGLHGVHVLIGVGLIAWLMVKNARGAFSAAYFTPVENVGLYWHLVDLIWIFLFPLLYLVK